MRLVSLIESYGSQSGDPTKKIIIGKCGEIAEGEDDGYSARGLADGYPDWPEEHNDGADLTAEEKIAISTALKGLGNDKYKAGDCSDASRLYTKAVRYVDAAGGCDDATNQAKAVCLSNRAQMNLKLGNQTEAVADATAVIEIPGIEAATKAKAYFRRAQGQSDDDVKKLDLQAALKLNPGKGSGPVKKELAKIKAKYADAVEKQRKAMAKMFG